MPAKVTLRVTAGPLQGRVFEFDRHDTFLFGRSPECHAELAAEDTTASRHHFLLEVVPPAIRLRDLGSLNGTHVNGTRYGGRGRNEAPEAAALRDFPQVDLKPGDQVRVGHTVFEVEAGVASDAPTPAACVACGGVCPAETSHCAACHTLQVKDPTAMLESLVESPPDDGSLRQLGGYDIGRLLGRGGMGGVYQARRRSDGKVAALKIMLSHVVVDESAREAFRREIDVTRALRHPGIVELFEHGSAGSSFYFAMEFCAGGSVFGLLKSGGPLPLAIAGRIALECLDGLACAHAQGFVHRDLKPENLLVSDREGRGAKITDFGLAKSFQQAGLSGMTATGAVAGTISFMPREQLIQFRLVKPVSDVWSMAATLYFMLTRQYARDFKKGQDPLQVILRGSVVPLRARDPRIPEAVAQVVDHALQDDPAARYQSAGEFRDALSRVL